VEAHQAHFPRAYCAAADKKPPEAHTSTAPWAEDDGRDDGDAMEGRIRERVQTVRGGK